MRGWLLYAFLALSVFGLIARGVDYLTGDPTTVGIVEVPPATENVWGWACITAALMLVVGMASHCYGLIITGAALAGAIYAALSVFALNVTVLTPPVDDWRFATELIEEAGMSWLLAVASIFRRDVLRARKQEE